MDAELVHLGVDRGIAVVTLDSPANRNALSARLVADLGRHVASALADDGVRALLLTATGTVFCSGADLKEAREGTGAPGGTPFVDVLRALLESPKPVVLKLNGRARAGGIGLVAAADIVIAPETVDFAFTEVRIGVAPAIISVPCSRRMSPRALSRWLLTGETFSAADAVDAGLVTVAVPPDEVDAETDRLLDALRLGAPTALRRTKELLSSIEGKPLDDALAEAAAVSAELFAGPDAAEGISAFREKRPPSWAG